MFDQIFFHDELVAFGSCKTEFESESVKYSGASERACERVSIQAQSTAVAWATASICNDERRRFGRSSGRGGMLHRLSDERNPWQRLHAYAWCLL
jgi:hypothetical protein